MAQAPNHGGLRKAQFAGPVLEPTSKLPAQTFPCPSNTNRFHNPHPSKNSFPASAGSVRAMAAPGVLDPTKAGQYPVILSDELLGKPSKETYTGIRCEWRPARALQPVLQH
jgi:hypothetical protein